LTIFFYTKLIILVFRKIWFSSIEDQNMESFHFPSLIFKNAIPGRKLRASSRTKALEIAGT
jgi:hypothetical protein